MNRLICPECESDDTEFIQFASGEEKVVLTQPDEVGDGLLELRMCNECGRGIENVLTVEKQQTIRP